MSNHPRVMTAALWCLLLLGGRAAVAGERPLEMLWVDMTPDALATPASRACVQSLRKAVTTSDTHTSEMGATALRKAVGAPADAPFFDLPHAALSKVRDRGDTRHDAVILVDCRPQLGQLDVLVVPTARGTARYQVRLPELDERAARWVGAAVLRRAWAGFVP